MIGLPVHPTLLGLIHLGNTHNFTNVLTPPPPGPKKYAFRQPQVISSLW